MAGLVGNEYEGMNKEIMAQFEMLKSQMPDASDEEIMAMLAQMEEGQGADPAMMPQPSAVATAPVAVDPTVMMTGAEERAMAPKPGTADTMSYEDEYASEVASGEAAMADGMTPMDAPIPEGNEQGDPIAAKGGEDGDASTTLTPEGLNDWLFQSRNEEWLPEEMAELEKMTPEQLEQVKQNVEKYDFMQHPFQGVIEMEQ